MSRLGESRCCLETLDAVEQRLTGLQLAETYREKLQNIRRVGAEQDRRRRSGKSAHFVARAVEVGIGSAALALLSPVILLTAILIRINTTGPALFRQTRVGKHGKLFSFYKFRSLYTDAAEQFPGLCCYNFSPDEVAGVKFNWAEDPRLTPVGRWLRRTGLDELPNIWNLLTGDIALVGPRPEVPQMLPYYNDEWLLKFSVRPGVTGLAQIHGRSKLAFRERVEWDLEYVRMRSPWLDMKILFQTVAVLARAPFESTRCATQPGGHCEIQ